MLETISWKAYWLTAGGALVLYYGWWLVKYAASLGWDLPSLKGKEREDDGRLAALYDLPAGEGAKKVMVMTEDATAAKKEVEQLLLPLPEPVGTDDAMFLKALATIFLKEVSKLIEKAEAEKMTEAELVFALQRLMGAYPYRRLRSTALQEKLSDSIVRALEKTGCFRLDVQVVNGLWGG